MLLLGISQSIFVLVAKTSAFDESDDIENLASAHYISKSKRRIDCQLI